MILVGQRRVCSFPASVATKAAAAAAAAATGGCYILHNGRRPDKVCSKIDGARAR